MWVPLCWVTQLFKCYAECCYAECHFAECRGAHFSVFSFLIFLAILKQIEFQWKFFKLGQQTGKNQLDWKNQFKNGKNCKVVQINWQSNKLSTTRSNLQIPSISNIIKLLWVSCTNDELLVSTDSDLTLHFPLNLQMYPTSYSVCHYQYFLPIWSATHQLIAPIHRLHKNWISPCAINFLHS